MPGPESVKRTTTLAAISHALDGQHAAIRFHRIDGVADDVKKYLYQLISIPAHARKHRLKLQFDFDIGIV